MNTLHIEFNAREQSAKNFKSYVWVNGKFHYHTGRNKKTLRGATNQAKREADLLFKYYVKTRDYDYIVVKNKSTDEIMSTYDKNPPIVKSSPKNPLYDMVTEWFKTKTAQEIFMILTVSGISVNEANDLITLPYHPHRQQNA